MPEYVNIQPGLGITITKENFPSQKYQNFLGVIGKNAVCETITEATK